TVGGGEQARVALVQLSIGDPELLLLDEPTSGIDGIARSSLIDYVQRTRRSRKVMLIVEHDLEFVAAVASTVVLVSDGILRPVAFQTDASSGALLPVLQES